MPNNISKKYSINLEAKSIKINVPRINVYAEDSVEFTCNIYEGITDDGLLIPRNLSDCTISACMLRETSKTIVTQKFGIDEEGIIEIIDAPNGVFKFKPKMSIMEIADKIEVQFTIEDLDEVVSVQPFLYYIADTICTGGIIIPENDIETLRDFEAKIDEVYAELDELVKDTTQMEEFIALSIEEMELQVETATTKAQEDFDTIEKEINDLTEDVNKKFIKQIQLEPFVPVGSNAITLKYKTEGVKAEKLIDTGINLHVSTKDGKGLGLSVMGNISFYMNNVNALPIIRPLITKFNDVEIDGIKISPSVAFGEGINYIYPETTNFEIWIKTNIPKEWLEGTQGYIQPIGQFL